MRKDLQTKSTVCTFTVLTLHYNIIHFLCTKIEVCDIQKKKKKKIPPKKQNKTKTTQKHIQVSKINISILTLGKR